MKQADTARQKHPGNFKDKPKSVSILARLEEVVHAQEVEENTTMIIERSCCSQTCLSHHNMDSFRSVHYEMHAVIQ